jgi:hypothetical protein
MGPVGERGNYWSGRPQTIAITLLLLISTVAIPGTVLASPGDQESTANLTTTVTSSSAGFWATTGSTLIHYTQDGVEDCRYSFPASPIEVDVGPNEDAYVTDPGGAAIQRIDTNCNLVWENTADTTASQESINVNGTSGVYVVSSDSNDPGVKRLDPADGTLMWQWDNPWGTNQRRVAIGGNYVVTGTDDPAVVYIYKHNGTKHDHYTTGSSPFIAMNYMNGSFYTSRKNGEVTKWSGISTKDWTTSLGSNVKKLEDDGTNVYAPTTSNVYSLDPASGNSSTFLNESPGEQLDITNSNRQLFMVYNDNVSVYDTSGGLKYEKTSESFHDVSSYSDIENLAAVSGVVKDGNGDPVADATVKVVGYDRDNYSGTASEIDSEIQANREELENPKPSGWTSQGGTGLQLAGSDGHFEDAGEYVAVHTADEWDLQGYQATDDANIWSVDVVSLEAPNVQVSSGEPVVLSLWDTSKDGFIQDQADEDLPGRTESGSIVVEQRGPAGDVLSSDTYDTQGLIEIFNTGANGGTKTHEAVVLDLSPGFYRVYAEGNEAAAYWIVVGSPDQIIQPYVENLEDESDALTTRASTLQDLQNNGKVVTKTVQADEAGEFTVTLGSRYDEVTLTAYRAPAELDGANVTRKEIIEYYESFVLADDGSLKATVSLADNQTTSYWEETGVPSSYYVSDGVTEATPPASNVTVRVEEISAPPVANASTRQTVEDKLRELIDQLSMSNVQSATQEVIEKVPVEDLRSQYAEQVGLIKKYEPAKERYLEISDREEVAAPSELSRSELETETAYMNQALYETDLTGGVEEPDVERANETVSVAWTVPGTDLESADVSVLAHWTNGTTDVVNESFVTVDASVIGDDVVRVNEYPVGEKDPAAVQFELRVAGDGEYRQRADTVKNPTFSGDLPALNSVRLSSTVPGPNDNVSVTFNPAEDGSYKSLKSVTVYGPDGSTVASTSPSDNRVSFDTSGAGLYTVKATLETTGGETVTVPIRFKASEADLARPPTITVRDSTVGTYALVGGPIQDAEITTQGAGEQVTVLAQVAEGERPDQLDVHLEELALPGTATTNVRVVQGDGQENVPGKVVVKIHYRSVGDSYQVRAHGQPVTESGTQYGQASPKDGGLAVKTWTQDDGSLEVKKVNNPTLRQRGAFWIDKQLLGAPSLGVPFAISPPALPDGLAAGVLLVAPVGLLAGRRRWSG